MYDFSIKKIINIVLLTIFVLFIIFYTHSRTAFLSQGANLSVSNLSNGQIVTESTLEITGIAKRATRLTINNRELVIDEEGNFADVLVFSPGLNNVEIVAEDKYGKGDDLKYAILYREEDSETLSDILVRHQARIETRTQQSEIPEEDAAIEESPEETEEVPGGEVIEINNDTLLLDNNN